MGRLSTLVLIGFGAFFIALAPLLKFWAADQIISAPANQFAIYRLEAKQAQYFSLQDLKVLTGDLDIIITTRGDVKESTGDRVVWDEATVVNDVTNKRALIDMSERRSAFNRFTGVGVNCCNSSVEKAAVTLEGQIYKFPFDVEKKTYKVFNSTAQKAYDATFVREDKVNGLPVYVFEQSVPPVKTETRTAPANVLGITGETGDVQVDRWYDGKTTYWVEPVTGSPVRQEQQRHEVLKTQDGIERSAAFIATAKMTDATVDSLVKDAEQGKSTINLLRNIIPLVLVIVGVVLVLAGVVMGRRRPAETE
jgi:Porin PorA